MTTFSLGNIKKGTVDKPDRILLYGVEKVGKSTFAADSPNPIFLCAEDGTSQLDVARFPEPKDLTEASNYLSALTSEQHDYLTLVIDTLDWLEPLIHKQVCAEAKKKTIEDFSWGKGHTAAMALWRQFFGALDSLREKRKMRIILLAHSHVRQHQDPTVESPYDRFELKLHKTASGLCKEWVDAILFAQIETYAVRGDSGKVRGVLGDRVIRTTKATGYDAGNRYGLPDTLPLSWAAYAAARSAGTAESRLLINEIKAARDEKNTQKINDWLLEAGHDMAKLKALLDWTKENQS